MFVLLMFLLQKTSDECYHFFLVPKKSIQFKINAAWLTAFSLTFAELGIQLTSHHLRLR